MPSTASAPRLTSITELLATLRTDDRDDIILPYDKYLLERCCVEAEEDQQSESSMRLEAAYLDCLRAELARECETSFSPERTCKRRSADDASESWMHCREHGSRSWPTDDEADGVSSIPLCDDLPELSAWALAAAEQEANRTRAKRRRVAMDIS